MKQELSSELVQTQPHPSVTGPDPSSARDTGAKEVPVKPAGALPRVAVLTGGWDKPYALGLAASLIEQEVAFDFIGSDDVDGPELHGSKLVRFLNLRGEQRPDAGLVRKVWRVLVYYGRLLWYATTTKARILHVLWHNKIELLDRTLVLLYYRLLGKRILLTVHNVNMRQRDGQDTFLNRWTLRMQYHLAAHMFVHTEQMKCALAADFAVAESRISVIPFGLNSSVPDTSLTGSEARQRLGLTEQQKVVLFFGNIAPYKGLEHLVEAMALLPLGEADYRFVIAGRPKGCATYWESIHQRITSSQLRSHVLERIEYVPDADTEIYFKAADVLVLPYTYIFQSGVLFLGYNFGLPVIASDIGSLKDDIIEGQTGFICRPGDPGNLANTIEKYFCSPLYKELATRRPAIRAFACERHSWTKVGEITKAVYAQMSKAPAN